MLACRGMEITGVRKTFDFSFNLETYGDKYVKHSKGGFSLLLILSDHVDSSLSDARIDNEALVQLFLLELFRHWLFLYRGPLL